MENYSYFIENKALFGSYPSQETIEILEKEGVCYFVDLTCYNEVNKRGYNTRYNYIKYPIIDKKYPKNWNKFAKLIINLCDTIKNLKGKEKMVINCKGGHGRSGLVVACILCYYYKISSTEALKRTNECHKKRVNMREKWRNIGSPQTIGQKIFVKKFFEPLYFCKSYRYGIISGLSNFSNHSVDIKNFGTFPTAEAAFNAYKNPENKKYVEKQIESLNPMISKRLGNSCNLRNDWDEIKYDIMYNILYNKYIQNKDIRLKLINTGLRPIILKTRSESYWGLNMDLEGDNKLGIILIKIRKKLYKEHEEDDYYYKQDYYNEHYKQKHNNEEYDPEEDTEEDDEEDLNIKKLI